MSRSDNVGPAHAKCWNRASARTPYQAGTGACSGKGLDIEFNWLNHILGEKDGVKLLLSENAVLENDHKHDDL